MSPTVTDTVQSQEGPRINTRDGNHPAHVKALYAWLHQDLPGIDWTQIPSRIIGYLVNAVGNAPHAPHIALAVGTALGTGSIHHLFSIASCLNPLLRTIRTQCETWNGSDLTREVWEEYVAKTEMTPGRYNKLKQYATVTERYLPDYVEHLTPEWRERVAPYLLPRLPARFTERYGGAKVVIAESRQRRKEKSDILVPLHTILVALVQFRKQAAQRMVQAFREACKRAESGEALPLHFSYEEVLTDVNRDAKSISEIHIEQRLVTLEFVLWDRSVWIEQHPDDFGITTKRKARRGNLNYRSMEGQYFVQYLGQASNLLWFGDLLEHGVLMHLDTPPRRSPALQERHLRRREYAHALGASNGFAVERPGLLTPSGGWGQWLARATSFSDAMIFEPESLYRGVLYASALATVALTNGGRVSELLQISADRFKGHSYTEKKQGQSREKQRVLWLQHLLPKGKRTEAERQLFPISPQAYELLREIGLLLKETYGSIPVIRPHSENRKAEDLSPERYLFQWAATADGHHGALNPDDVSTLLRFILHGLEFRTKQGEPFVVSTHLLRHVMATAARHEHEVPAQAVAFVLHHQQTDFAIPASTQYYSQQTEDKQLAALAEFLIDVEEQAASLLLSVPGERTLEQMDEDLRGVFERWHVLLETAFGFCGCIGLCPRGYARNLCIGCPHLVPDPRKRENALKWRASYVTQAEELGAQGENIDARQVRLQVQELDDLINSMDVMKQAIEDGTRTPVFLQLPSASLDEVTVNAEA